MEQVDVGYTELRSYQREMKHRLYEKWWGGSRSVMVQMPTGTGKTFLMAAVVRENAADGVLVVTHRIELVEQISETLSRFGVRHGVIAGGQKALLAENVRVASIQTLSRCIDSLSSCPSVVVVDEAHHALAKTYRILWEKWPEALFLGMTATPCRLSGEPFTDLFEVLLQAWSMERFIDEGWLADFEYISADPNSKAVRRVGLLSKRGADGDYQLKEMATVMDCPESIRHLYDTYQTFASGKKGIVYAINREHARHIVEDTAGGTPKFGGRLSERSYHLDGQCRHILRRLGRAGGGGHSTCPSHAFISQIFTAGGAGDARILQEKSRDDFGSSGTISGIWHADTKMGLAADV